MSKGPADGRTVVITGASGGIGLAGARAFTARGDTVYSLSRTAPDDPAIRHIPCDITSEESARAAVDAVLLAAGRIDVLVLNAGVGVSGSAEHTPLSEIRRQFDVNFFGNVCVLQRALPGLRAHGGAVLFVSSVAANVAIPFQAYYSCVKASTSMLVLALRSELKPYPVRVAAVLPGDVKTGFTAARRKTEAGRDVYPAMQSAIARMERDETGGMPPSRIADRLVRLSLSKNPKPLSTVGPFYKLVLALMKLLPARFGNWLVGLLYS